MRKHNHLIQPALKQDSRLINSAVRSRKCKRPNAQKHGIFAMAAITLDLVFDRISAAHEH